MSLSFRTNGNYIDLISIDDTTLHKETLIKRLHNTSRCVQWSLPTNTNRITFTIDESKYEEILITDVDFDGVSMNSQDDFETGITEMFPGLAPGEGSPGGSSYLVYHFQVMQNGTDLPEVLVFENTLGSTVVWTREAAGQYRGTGEGAVFPDDQLSIPGFGTFSGSGNPFMPLWGESGAILGYLTLYQVQENAIEIRVANPSGTLVDLSTLIGSTKIWLEVRIYPPQP